MKSKLATSLLCMAQAASLCLGGYPALAASSTSTPATSDTTKLEGFERTVFGETKKDRSEDARLKELEVNLFGSAKSGSKSERIEAVSKALSSSSGNLLMPALAPKMDTGSAAAAAGSAPVAPAYVDAAEANADKAKTELRHAMELYSHGSTQQAEQSFRQVLAIDNRNGDAYFNLGVIAEGKGDLQAALFNYRSAASMNPNDPDLRNAVDGVQNKIQQAAEVERHKNEQQAVAAKQAVDERQRESLKGYTSDASAAFKAGNFDKAISDLQYVARQAPNDADVQYALGQAYRGKGDNSSARSYLGRAVQLAPSNTMYSTALSQLDGQVAQGGGARGGGGGGSGMPPAAPDFHNAGSSPAQLTAYNHGDLNSDLIRDTNSSAPVGQLTPFSGDDSAHSNTQRGFANSAGGFGAMLGGGGGYSQGYGYSNGSTRLKRAAVTGLTGAAMGAVMSSMFAPSGYRGRSAMRGAMMGGALGVITGGLLSR